VDSESDDPDDVLLLLCRLFFSFLLCLRFLSSESEELQLELPLSEEYSEPVADDSVSVLNTEASLLL
jgi:hypothetical protein